MTESPFKHDLREFRMDLVVFDDTFCPVPFPRKLEQSNFRGLCECTTRFRKLLKERDGICREIEEFEVHRFMRARGRPSSQFNMIVEPTLLSSDVVASVYDVEAYCDDHGINRASADLAAHCLPRVLIQSRAKLVVFTGFKGIPQSEYGVACIDRTSNRPKLEAAPDHMKWPVGTEFLAARKLKIDRD